MEPGGALVAPLDAPGVLCQEVPVGPDLLQADEVHGVSASAAALALADDAFRVWGEVVGKQCAEHDRPMALDGAADGVGAGAKLSVCELVASAVKLPFAVVLAVAVGGAQEACMVGVAHASGFQLLERVFERGSLVSASVDATVQVGD